MPRLVIDNQPVEVADGGTILDAAGKLGIEIPTLCFLPGRPAETSCMVCVVALADGRLVPACGARAEEGMVVESDGDRVRQARRAALEMLLSDHVGDCDGPCQAICPAGMNIPRMLRQIADGHLAGALATAREGLALPATLGWICPAPCERGCRRGGHDSAVSIRLLHGFVAEADIGRDDPLLPPRAGATGKSVAMVGAGPAGLAAAQFLLQQGHACTILDDHDLPGGMLRYGMSEDKLPRAILDAEAAVVAGLGAEFRCGVRVGEGVSLAELRSDFDAIFMAPGELETGQAEQLGLEASPKGIKTDPATCATATPGVFAGGSAVTPRRMAVRAVADGKLAAACIGQFLAGGEVAAPVKRFNSRMGPLAEGEIDLFLSAASSRGRVDFPPAGAGGLDQAEARAESRRCLHCDCRKPDACALRRYSELYGARQRRPHQRRRFEVHAEHPDVIYEPGKCIACGICIRIAAEAGEELGLTFVGRGFDTRVAVPFARPLSEGLGKAASECVDACPTGALAFKNA